MFKHSVFAVALLAVLSSGACSSARRTGSTVKDATVATGREVGDKTEDAAEAVGDKTADAAEGLAETTADATITSAVKMKFAADKIVEAFAIDVDTKNGVVTLTGSVKSKSEADRAIMLAKGVEGVKSVTPNLTISTQ